jgi:phage FluMu gp28-like protein
VVLSAGERQALEVMAKAKQHTEAWDVAVSDYEELRDSPEALLRAADIRWPNGSRLIAIPANPATARGYSANLLLDEFAFHEQPDLIWRSVYPSITNPLKGLHKVWVLSTPNGMGNKFADLWHAGEPWSRHTITIHDAAAQGLDIDVEEIRTGLGDPEGWAQEYECQFLDQATVLLPYELIGKCESLEAQEVPGSGFFESRHGGLFLGLDFGRKKNLTVCWALKVEGDVARTVEVLTLEGADTPTQVQILKQRIRSATRICIDYTGPGVGLGDYLVREHGEYDPEGHKFGKVELLTFSNTSKVDVFSKLRMAFETLKVRIPVSRAIREDLHSIHRVALPSGTVTYRAPHTDDGHADRATALALAVRAVGTLGAGAILDPTAIRVGASAFRPRVHKPMRIT